MLLVFAAIYETLLTTSSPMSKKEVVHEKKLSIFVAISFNLRTTSSHRRRKKWHDMMLLLFAAINFNMLFQFFLEPELHVFDRNSHKLLHRLEGHEYGGQAVRFSSLRYTRYISDVVMIFDTLESWRAWIWWPGGEIFHPCQPHQKYQSSNPSDMMNYCTRYISDVIIHTTTRLPLWYVR